MRAEGSITEHVDAAGRVRFRVRLTIGGKRKSLGLYDTREAAEKALSMTLEALGENGRGLSLAAWGRMWLDRRETDGYHRGGNKVRSAWNAHVATAHFAEMPLAKIARTDVVRWIRELLRTEATSTKKTKGVVERTGLGRKLGRQTVTNALALLRRALNDAADEGHAPTNVAMGVGVPKVARSDDPWTYLTANEIARVFALPLAADQRAIFAVAIYTGMRPGEMWGLRWADVTLDGERPELVVRFSYRGPTKTGKVRRVPLLAQAREALATWKREAPGVGAALVFPAEAGRRADGLAGCHHEGYEAGWQAVRVAAGIERRVRFYDLRHTCASSLISGTWGRAWSLEEVQGVLGHQSRTTTERYAHLAPESLHGARAETDANQRTPSGHFRP